MVAEAFEGDRRLLNCCTSMLREAWLAALVLMRCGSVAVDDWRVWAKIDDKWPAHASAYLNATSTRECALVRGYARQCA